MNLLINTLLNDDNLNEEYNGSTQVYFKGNLIKKIEKH